MFLRRFLWGKEQRSEGSVSCIWMYSLCWENSLLYEFWWEARLTCHYKSQRTNTHFLRGLCSQNMVMWPSVSSLNTTNSHLALGANNPKKQGLCRRHFDIISTGNNIQLPELPGQWSKKRCLEHALLVLRVLSGQFHGMILALVLAIQPHTVPAHF